MLLTPQHLHEYQKECVYHSLYNPDVMLWLQVGLGKTPITLTTIVDRMRAGQVQKTLIFAPLRVIQSVWGTEARKWTHTKHLRFSIIHGTPEKRSRALFSRADIYLCNYENMSWLANELNHHFINKGHPLPFQMVVYDEITRCKNSTSQRIMGSNIDVDDGRGGKVRVKKEGWRQHISNFQYRMGLTGTPAPNGYLDIFGQFLVVDGGQRLGEYVTHYKEAYFSRNYNGWGWTPTELGKQVIENKIAPITKKMDAIDYLDLPEVTVINKMITLPPKARAAYKEIEKEMFTALDDGTEFEVFNKASLSNKTLQFCNGAPYLSPLSKEYQILHTAKLDALEEVINESGGSPILCSYTFRSDAECIMKRFKKLKPVNMTAEPASKTGEIIERWKRGEIGLLLGHPASMGHGIDGLQYGGSIIVWYGLPWNLEWYLQLNGREDRQGQKHPVSIIRLLCDDTIDLAVADAIEGKDDTQEGLKASLQKYRSNGVKIHEGVVNNLMSSFL